MKNQGLVEFENRKTKAKAYMPVEKVVAFLEDLARENALKHLPLGTM